MSEINGVVMTVGVVCVQSSCGSEQTRRRAGRSWLTGVVMLCPTFAMAAMASVSPWVALTGVMGDKVVLSIDGQPRVMALGTTSADGWRVQRAGSHSVVVENAGHRRQIVMGEGPVPVGPSVESRPVTLASLPQALVLEAGADQLFQSDGEINGHAVRGVVDTGATLVVLSRAVAQRLGVSWQAGPVAEVQTPTGIDQGNLVVLSSVRLGSLQAQGVQAVVVSGDLPYVLYGNSFLRSFRLQWDRKRLTLTP